MAEAEQLFEFQLVGNELTLIGGFLKEEAKLEIIEGEPDGKGENIELKGGNEEEDSEDIFESMYSGGNEKKDKPPTGLISDLLGGTYSDEELSLSDKFNNLLGGDESENDESLAGKFNNLLGADEDHDDLVKGDEGEFYIL